MTTKRGDIWELGRHRIMCGDSTDGADVSRLLDGAAPNIMVTDPPYGVSYYPEWRKNAFADGKGARSILMPENDGCARWSSAWRNFGGDVAYVWHAASHCADVHRDLEEQGFQIRNQIIWVKNRPTISRGHYNWQHEPCFYSIRIGKTASWLGDRRQHTVWHIPVIQKIWCGHSTQKPIACMERPIMNHGGDVYDPFVGSGTTILAAEKQSRTCYAMEIYPEFVDMAVDRWHKFKQQLDFFSDDCAPPRRSIDCQADFLPERQA